jgi:LmbE family N-acetylglucosaminyl deacetylase
MSSPHKLLCVVAHPDDECFAFGGALALAADAGVETSVVCFTDGQAATNRGAAASAAELGAMRRAEFAASCRILGVTHHELLDYQDAQLDSPTSPRPPPSSSNAFAASSPTSSLASAATAA